MIPLELHDGRKIDTSNGSLIREEILAPAQYVPVPTHSEAASIITETRRRLSDLPDKPDNLHPTAIILTYHLFGLSNEQIAIGTNTNVAYVEGIIDSDHFKFMLDTISNDVSVMQRDTMMSILEQGATTAASTQVNLLRSEDEAVQLAASKQIIDRVAKDNQERVSSQRMPALNIHISGSENDTQLNIKMG